MRAQEGMGLFASVEHNGHVAASADCLLTVHASDSDVRTEVLVLDGSVDQVLDLHRGSQHAYAAVGVDVDFQCSLGYTEATGLVILDIRRLRDQSLFDRFERDEADVPDAFCIHLQEHVLGLLLDRIVGESLGLRHALELLDAEARYHEYGGTVVEAEQMLDAKMQQYARFHQIDARLMGVNSGGGGCGRSLRVLGRADLFGAACLRFAMSSRGGGICGSSGVVGLHFCKEFLVTCCVSRTGSHAIVGVPDSVTNRIPSDSVFCGEVGASCAIVYCGDNRYTASFHANANMLFFHHDVPFLKSCVQHRK